LILAHNHPSGQKKPSQADRDITKKIVEAGRLFEIAVADHLIMAGNTYVSFADEGWM
jgi:DNA repair protein RadC